MTRLLILRHGVERLREALSSYSPGFRLGTGSRESGVLPIGEGREEGLPLRVKAAHHSCDQIAPYSSVPALSSYPCGYALNRSPAQ
jgi:hypothetical protein